MAFKKTGGKTTTKLSADIIKAVKPPKKEFNFDEWNIYTPSNSLNYKLRYCELQFENCLSGDLPKIMFDGTLSNETKVLNVHCCSNCQALLVNKFKTN